MSPEERLQELREKAAERSAITAAFADGQKRAMAAADWDRSIGEERGPDRFSLWALIGSLAGLVLISVGVGFGLSVGC